LIELRDETIKKLSRKNYKRNRERQRSRQKDAEEYAIKFTSCHLMPHRGDLNS